MIANHINLITAWTEQKSIFLQKRHKLLFAYVAQFSYSLVPTVQLLVSVISFRHEFSRMWHGLFLLCQLAITIYLSITYNCLIIDSSNFRWLVWFCWGRSVKQFLKDTRTHQRVKLSFLQSEPCGNALNVRRRNARQSGNHRKSRGITTSQHGVNISWGTLTKRTVTESAFNAVLQGTTKSKSKPQKWKIAARSCDQSGHRTNSVTVPEPKFIMR